MENKLNIRMEYTERDEKKEEKNTQSLMKYLKENGFNLHITR